MYHAVEPLPYSDHSLHQLLPYSDHRFVLLCHSVGTSLPEIALSAWMSASSFAGSPRRAFTLTRNVAAPAVVLLGALRLLVVKCLRLALLLTSLFCLHLPNFLQLSAALGYRTDTAWVLSQGCCVMPRQRPLVLDGSSWILPLRVFCCLSLFPRRFV